MGIDEVTVVFTVGLSVIVGLLSGAVPALQWSRLDLVRTLNEGSAQSAGGFRLLRSNRARAVLVMAQVALALVLLVGTGLLLRSFVRLVTFDRGYDPANVVSAQALFPFSSQPSMAPGARANSQDRSPDEMRADPCGSFTSSLRSSPSWRRPAARPWPMEPLSGSA